MKAFIFELASLMAALLSFPIPATLFDPPPKPATTRPILLVHGYLLNSSTWHLFRKRLRNAGYTTVYTINLGSPLHCIEDYAKKVKNKADKIAKETGRDDLTLIGHSMGGIVSCYYATHFAKPGTVKQVFTIGSPMLGTKAADMGFGKCVKDMRHTHPFTPFITDLLHKMSNMESVSFYHIGSPADRVVIPYRSNFPPINKPHVKHFSIENVGHLSLIFSREVTQVVINELNQK